jgi:hypothetical protein
MRIFLKTTSFCLALIFVLTSSCKKDNTPTGGSSSQQEPAKYSNVYGVLIGGKVVDYFSPTFSDTSYEAAAVFYNGPQTNIAISNANTTSVTAVSLNNVPLYLYSPSSTTFIYEDTASNLKINNLNWQVQGAGAIPSFVQMPVISYPSYSGYTSLPDTINIGMNTAFKITGTVNADSSHIAISSSSSKQYSSPNFGSSITNYTVTSNSMASLDTTSHGRLSVLCEKILVQNINGKNIVFIKSFQFNKNVVLINQ